MPSDWSAKKFKWDDEKNRRLKSEKGISFDEIVWHIGAGKVLDVYEHPNQVKYKAQRVFVINVNDYAWLVPFVESDDILFLKTIIPSRKVTKQYFGGPA